MRNTSIAGVPLSMMRKEEMLIAMGEAIRSGNQLSVVAINARKVVRAVREPGMRQLILGFDLFLADGSAVVKAVDHTAERITGIDLMEEICRNGGKLGARVFFYGATEESNRGARKTMKERYPDLEIAGYCNGYEDQDVLEKIRASRANVVFVAKGTPLQEQWILENRGKTGASVLMGVGGAFDVFAGKIRRAPAFIQRLGLEWLYRMMREPRRFAQIPELLEFKRLVRREKKQVFQKIDGGTIWNVKKLPW